MKKTSLFILLILLTFSLSQSNFKIHFQSKQAYIGIRETDKIYDYISNKMNFSKDRKEKIKKDLEDLEYCQKHDESSYSYIPTPNKLREFKINSYRLEAEHLKINKKYVIYLVYIADAIIEKPPKYERKCVQHLFGKRCKNQQVSQIFLDSELKEVKKKIEKQIIKDALIINLPQENYETFKNILLSKFPNAKF